MSHTAHGGKSHVLVYIDARVSPPLINVKLTLNLRMDEKSVQFIMKIIVNIDKKNTNKEIVLHKKLHIYIYYEP